MTNILKILPLAVVMVAGPQIISAIMLATSEKAKKNSVAYVGGAMLAATLGTAIMFMLTSVLNRAAESSSSSSNTVDYVLILLLLILMVRVYMKRKATEPPKWMGKLQSATPKFAFRLGLLLFFLMPTDILTMLTVGGYLSSRGEPFVAAIPFLLVTALFIGSPLLILLLLGKKGEVLLPKMRDWMNTNSWIVSEVVIIFFLAMEISSVVG